MKQILNQLTLIMKNPDRRVTVFIHDIIAMVVAVQLSFWFYYGDNVAYFSPYFMPKQMLIFGLLCAGFFLWFQTYRGVWRYVSITQILVLAGAIGFASLVYLPLATKMSVQNFKIPQTLILLNWGIAVSLVTTSRLFYRAFTERWMAPESTDLSPKPTTRLIMIGISRELERFLSHLRQVDAHSYEILGIITDHEKYTGRSLQGYQVLGTLEDLPDLIENFNAEGEHPHQLVIASTQFLGQKLHDILKLTSDLKVDLFKLPNLESKQSQSIEIQPLTVDDFFTFPTDTALKTEWSSLFKSEKVLIIGASTLIGKQIIRALLTVGADQLILCDANHLALAELRDELSGVTPPSKIQFFLTHLYDAKKYDHLLSQHKPTMVIYLDGIYEDEVSEANPLETLAENNLKTKLIMDAVAEKKIKNFMYVIQSQISHEASLGQLTIKVAEAYCQALDQEHLTTRFIPIKLAPTVSTESEFVFKLKQLFELRKPIDLNCPNQPYSLLAPASAALSVLKSIYIALQNDHIRGKSLAEILSHQTTLTDFIELVARLEGLSMDAFGNIRYVSANASGETLEYKQKETLRFEKTAYNLLGYNLSLKTFEELFKNLQEAVEQCDQQKALSLIKELVSPVSSQSK